MHFTDSTIAVITERLAQLGFGACPVCASASMKIDRRPGVLEVGGVDHETRGPEPEAGVVFLVRYLCDVCGHVMFFDADRFHLGDRPLLERD
jgi:hypothetical protein